MKWMRKYKDMNGLELMSKKCRIERLRVLIKCKLMNLVYKLSNKLRKRSFLRKIKKYFNIVLKKNYKKLKILIKLQILKIAK